MLALLQWQNRIRWLDLESARDSRLADGASSPGDRFTLQTLHCACADACADVRVSFQFAACKCNLFERFCSMSFEAVQIDEKCVLQFKIDMVRDIDADNFTIKIDILLLPVLAVAP